MDKWQKLKDFLTDGKEHITKDFYVSRPSVFEEILDIMEELERRETSELEKIKAEFLYKCKEDYRFDNEIILNGFEELIDKHIAELKGNKE